MKIAGKVLGSVVAAPFVLLAVAALFLLGSYSKDSGGLD